jgi:hypothetical protein
MSSSRSNKKKRSSEEIGIVTPVKQAKQSEDATPIRSKCGDELAYEYTVRVSNLSKFTTRQSFKEFAINKFNVPSPSNIIISYDYESGTLGWVAYLDYDNLPDALSAIELLDGKTLDDKRLRAKQYQPKTPPSISPPTTQTVQPDSQATQRIEEDEEFPLSMLQSQELQPTRPPNSIVTNAPLTILHAQQVGQYDLLKQFVHPSDVKDTMRIRFKTENDASMLYTTSSVNTGFRLKLELVQALQRNAIRIGKDDIFTHLVVKLGEPDLGRPFVVKVWRADNVLFNTPPLAVIKFELRNMSFDICLTEHLMPKQDEKKKPCYDCGRQTTRLVHNAHTKYFHCAWTYPYCKECFPDSLATGEILPLGDCILIVQDGE